MQGVDGFERNNPNFGNNISLQRWMVIYFEYCLLYLVLHAQLRPHAQQKTAGIDPGH